LFFSIKWRKKNDNDLNNSKRKRQPSNAVARFDINESRVIFHVRNIQVRNSKYHENIYIKLKYGKKKYKTPLIKNAQAITNSSDEENSSITIPIEWEIDCNSNLTTLNFELWHITNTMKKKNPIRLYMHQSIITPPKK